MPRTADLAHSSALETVAHSTFGSGDFLIALSFGLLNLLDEVVLFHDGIGGVDHHNVHIDELIIGNLFTSHHIAAVDNAVFHVLSVVVKENLLGVVVGLVDHHQLTSVRFFVLGSPAGVIFLDEHGAGLFESLENSLVDFEGVIDNFSLILVDESQLGRITTLMVACDHSSIFHSSGSSIHVSLLVGVRNSEFFTVLGAVKFDERSSVTAVKSGVLSRAELVEFIDHVRLVTAKSTESN